MLKQISIEVLEKMHVSKGELFENINVTFDYALPQNWLEDFSQWCKRSFSFEHVTYDMIASTTVWLYPRNGYSFPLTACKEVMDAYSVYLAKDPISQAEYIERVKEYAIV